MTGLPGWITDPALQPAWDRIRERFEKAGLEARGRVRIAVSTRAQRHAVGALLGRNVTGGAVGIDLGDLDARLRERSGVGGLATVLTLLSGTPLQDRPAARAARTASREQPLQLAAELVDTTWSPDWVAGLRQSGLLTNRSDAQRTVRDAAAVLLELTSPGRGPDTLSRVEVGATIVGDAHALDRDRLLHHIVVRGLAAASAMPNPATSAEREHLWAVFGVESDLLSRTCLVWGLRVTNAAPAAQRLNDAAEAGDPVHLTAWDLRRIASLRPHPGTRVLVCENPRVLEALAERHLPGWAAVCTSGEPNLVVDKVLRDLADVSSLYYHGDFDWPGIAIANRIIDRVRAHPWHMGAQEYLLAVRPDGPPLSGKPVEPTWDAELGAAMRTHDRAVHEEAVLSSLLGSMA